MSTTELSFILLDLARDAGLTPEAFNTRLAGMLRRAADIQRSSLGGPCGPIPSVLDVLEWGEDDIEEGLWQSAMP